MAVTELGYMGLGVSDLEAWQKFAREIVGLEVVDEGEGDRCYLRMDYWHHRIVLHRDESDDLAYLGFRVAGADEFLDTQKQLADAGIEFRLGTVEEAEERRVLELLKLADPDGNPIEIFHGPLVRFAKPFHPGRGMHGKFLTGEGGLGHCIVRERDPEAAVRFYQALGMRGGVEYKFGKGVRSLQLRFMHCNARDHSVAFGIGSPQKRLNHIMLEVDNLDDVGLTHDLVRKAKIPVHIQLGKHSNDHMYSFYFRSPSGFMIEYGYGARPATHQSEYYGEDFYGHGPEEGGF
ncbi:MAG TPA: VOC family protein [Myxococcota bacterium]|nr:VOC family protein [Myxococcota bacterium]